MYNAGCEVNTTIVVITLKLNYFLLVSNKCPTTSIKNRLLKLYKIDVLTL